jgi:hypothetical protein
MLCAALYEAGAMAAWVYPIGLGAVEAKAKAKRDSSRAIRGMAQSSFLRYGPFGMTWSVGGAGGGFVGVDPRGGRIGWGRGALNEEGFLPGASYFFCDTVIDVTSRMSWYCKWLSIEPIKGR